MPVMTAILKNKKVAIIGAGPVGLTMARLLQLKGLNVTVYERDKNPAARIWGGTLDLHENSGQKALDKAGLLEGYFAKAKPIGRNIVDTQARLIFTVSPHYKSPEINRNDLRNLMLNSITSDTVIWDSKFTSIEVQNGQWLLRFENGRHATADFVIGANGGMSKARHYATDTVVEDTGTFIIQGEVYRPETKCNAFYELCGDNILMTAGEGRTLVANPDNNGALTYNVTFKKPKEWDNGNGLEFKDAASVTAFLINMFPHWDECYHQLFRATSFFVGLPSRRLPLDSPWKSDRPLPITLIGDAAHVMPPFAGRGVNMGLMDAFILSENLTCGKFDTVAAAIDDYEQQMFIYAKKAQLETNRNETEMHSPNFFFAKRFNS